jgi:hypothetical protein
MPTLLLSASRTGIFKSPFSSGLPIFGSSIFAPTFKSIPPVFFFCFSSELDELELDSPFFNRISTLALTNGILIVRTETFLSSSHFPLRMDGHKSILDLSKSKTENFKSLFTSVCILLVL